MVVLIEIGKELRDIALDFRMTVQVLDIDDDLFAAEEPGLGNTPDRGRQIPFRGDVDPRVFSLHFQHGSDRLVEDRCQKEAGEHYYGGAPGKVQLHAPGHE